MNDTSSSAPKDHFAGSQPAIVDIQVGGTRGMGIELGVPLPAGQGHPKVLHEDRDGLSADIDGSGIGVREDDATLTDEEKAELDAAANKEDAPGEDDKSEQQPLPEFDPEKPEVVAAYDKRFVGEAGEYNMEALTADWMGNLKDGGDPASGSLSEGTYKWLEKRGVSRDLAKSIEAGQVAQVKVRQGAILERAGGQEAYQAAIEWARQGGYSKAEAERFNRAINGVDDSARNDAVDLIMARYTKANPTGRPASPKRTTASAGGANQGGSTGGVEPYKNVSEWRADNKKARDTNDQKLLDLTRKRLKVSPWWSGYKK